MEEEEKLYMPLGIKKDKEYASGFGKDEAIKALKASIIFVIIAVISYMIYSSIVICMGILMVSIPVCVMMNVKSDTNISPVDYIEYMISYSKSQKVYQYVYQDEWGIDDASEK